MSRKEGNVAYHHCHSTISGVRSCPLPTLQRENDVLSLYATLRTALETADIQYDGDWWPVLLNATGGKVGSAFQRHRNVLCNIRVPAIKSSHPIRELCNRFLGWHSIFFLL